MSRNAAAAYSATGSAWEHGPARIYNRLAEIVVAALPVSIDGASTLDLGAGTGAATRALLAAGAGRVVAVDAATGMLSHNAGRRPPAERGPPPQGGPAGGEAPRLSASAMVLRSIAWLAASRTRLSAHGDFGSV